MYILIEGKKKIRFSNNNKSKKKRKKKGNHTEKISLVLISMKVTWDWFIK